MAEAAIMICYRECLSNLAKFRGDDEQKIEQFINNIERIGKMIDASDDILHCMCTAKLDGEAKRWFEYNTSLDQWMKLKPALIERFTSSDSSSKLFEQLKERRQKPEETITSYYDAIIKLCHQYDPTMSQKIMISWLENGVKDSLRIPIKRQMKLLSETTRTTQAFLKIAKDEQELQEEKSPGLEPTSLHTPYFASTVSTTLQQPVNARQNPSTYALHRPTIAPHPSRRPFQRTYHGKNQQPSQRRSHPIEPSSPTMIKKNMDDIPVTNTTSLDLRNNNTRQSKACLICKKHNHRAIDCYYKQPQGCYKCGQSEHRLRDCPEVFY